MEANREEMSLLIERYLDVQMAEDEKSAFVARLEKEPKLAEEVEKHRAIRFMIAHKEAIPLTAEEKSKSREAFELALKAQKGQRKRFLYTTLISVFAALALLLFFANRSIVAPFPENTQDLLSSFQKDYMQPSTLMGGEQLLMDASEAFRKEDFEQAIQFYGNFLESYPENLEAQKALGFSYARAGQYKRAAEVFDSLRQMLPDEKLLQWYQALALVQIPKQKARNLGIALLEELVAEEGQSDLGIDARKLLESLP